IWLSWILFFGDAAIPNSRSNEDDAASGRECNQERQRQIKPRADRRRRREPGAKITVKRAGPRALQALLQDQLHGLVIVRERRRAGVRANHALRRRSFGAIGAQRASAVSANGDGFSMMGGAFHEWLDERKEAASRIVEMQIR